MDLSNITNDFDGRTSQRGNRPDYIFCRTCDGMYYTDIEACECCNNDSCIDGHGTIRNRPVRPVRVTR